jgi:hypothetical protein
MRNSVDPVRHYCYVFLNDLYKAPWAGPARQRSQIRWLPRVSGYWELGTGDFAVIGADITDMAGSLPPSAGCGPDERMVRIPRKTLVLAKSAIPDQV